MTEPNRPVNIHKAYHAHIYFDEASKSHAKTLCDASADQFGLNVGRFFEKLVGPHPCWSCQIIFGTKDFDRYVSWLEENRKGLTVLVHAVTGDDVLDHTDYAYWLGDPVVLNLKFFGIS